MPNIYPNDTPEKAKERERGKIDCKRDHDMQAPITVQFGGDLYGFRKIDEDNFDKKINRKRPFDWKTISAGGSVSRWVTLSIEDAEAIALLVDDVRTQIFKDADAAKAALG